MGSLVAYGLYLYWSLPKQPELPKILPPQQVGKTKYVQSKNGDASMATELNRRRAIQAQGRIEPHKIKESRTSYGSSTGALEAFMITSICPPIIRNLICDYIYDGGNADDEYCEILDDEYDGVIYDAGNADTIVCGV